MAHDNLIRARRDALAAQLAEGQQQYQQLENALAMLQRNLDAMHGGLQELEALLQESTDDGNERP